MRSRARGADLRQGACQVPAVSRQFLHQATLDVQLAHRAKLLGSFSEAAREVSSHVAIKLQKREQFSKPSRGHARAVEGFDLARVDAVQIACKCVEPRPEWPVQMSWPIHEVAECSRPVTGPSQSLHAFSLHAFSERVGKRWEVTQGLHAAFVRRARERGRGRHGTRAEDGFRRAHAPSAPRMKSDENSVQLSERRRRPSCLPGPAGPDRACCPSVLPIALC